jgi:hypothetical protein
MGWNRKTLRIFFIICLVIWIFGAIVTYQYASPVKQIKMLTYGLSEVDRLMMNIRGICINLFGTLAIGSGLILLVLWAIRKFGNKAGASPVAANKPAPSPEPTFRVQQVQGTKVDFSQWMINDNTLSKRFRYAGAANMTLYAEITVEMSSMGMPLRFINFFAEPPIGIEGEARLLITDKDTQKSAGWIAVRTNTTNDNSTIINVVSRPNSDAVFEALSQTAEYDFILKQGDEVFVHLPLPSEAGLDKAYAEVRGAK